MNTEILIRLLVAIMLLAVLRSGVVSLVNLLIDNSKRKAAAVKVSARQ